MNYFFKTNNYQTTSKYCYKYTVSILNPILTTAARLCCQRCWLNEAPSCPRPINAWFNGFRENYCSCNPIIKNLNKTKSTPRAVIIPTAFVPVIHEQLEREFDLKK